MGTVTFNNGDTLQIMDCFPGSEFYNGSNREILMLHFNSIDVPYETIRNIHNDEFALSTIYYSFEIDGSVTSTEYINYTIPAGITTFSNEGDDADLIILKVARRTETELIQQELQNTNVDIQMALVELGNMSAELANQIAELAMIVNATTATEEESEFTQEEEV